MDTPYCELCHTDPEQPPFRQGDFVSFADVRPPPIPGQYLAYCEKWFCNDHLAAAQALSHLKAADALLKLQEQYGKFEIPVPRYPDPPPQAKQTLWQRLRKIFE